MSLNALRKGQRIQAGASEFLILQRLPDNRWQLQNTATGEWCTFTEDDLLDRFARSEISFIAEAEAWGPAGGLAAKLTRDLAAYPPELVALGRKREQYLKEIDRRQPISMTRTSMEPLIRLVSERVNDDKPPGWLTVWRSITQVGSRGPRRPGNHLKARRPWQEGCSNRSRRTDRQRSGHRRVVHDGRAQAGTRSASGDRSSAQ